jgi:integrase
MATITKRGDTYRIRVSCGYDINGKQIMRSTTWDPEPGMTKKQIEKELQRQTVLFEEKCRSGQFLDGSIKFAEFAEQWFRDYANSHLRPTTLSRYRILMKRINPAIGHIRLDKLQPQHLIEFFNNLQEPGIGHNGKYKIITDLKSLLKERGLTKVHFAKQAGISLATLDSIDSGNSVYRSSAEKVSVALTVPIDKIFKAVDPDAKLSDSTIKYYYILINAILNKAVKWKVILDNPCKYTDPPRIRKKEMRYLDEEGLKRVFVALLKEPIQYQTMIILLINLGMRRGELLGLEWKDIDWRTGTITIRRSSLYTRAKGIFTDEPKTESGYRSIKAPDSVIDTLKFYRTWQKKERLKMGDQWQDADRLFTRWNGLPIHPDSLGDWWRKFIKKNALPSVPIHGLRHTNATLLIAGGVNIRTVANRLGHAKASTTSNIYAHAIKSADETAAETIQNILEPLKKSQ